MKAKKRTTPSVSLKPEERYWLECQAEEAGVSLGRYMREVALCERSQDGEKISRAHLLDKLIQQVRAIGNNINQIALHGNQNGQVKPQRLEEMRNQLRDIRQRIYEVLE